MSKKITYLYLVFILLCSFFELSGQTTPPNTYRYQGVARNASGVPIASQPVSILIGLYSDSLAGTLVWEESSLVSTDADGVFICFIGNGVSTGNGTLPFFSMIPWGANQYFVKVSIDFSGGSSYTPMGSATLFSVPYSFYSDKTEKLIVPIDYLSDVDTSGCNIGKVLKYDGLIWRPQPPIINDSANYAASASASVFSDTTSNTLNSVNSDFSDTSAYAINFVPYNWSVDGNVAGSGHFLGTLDTTDLVFKTSAVERMRLVANGNLGIGTSIPNALLHVQGNDGFVASGSFGSGILADSSFNTRLMFYPAKAAFRVGQVDNNSWSQANIGNYSLAAGYDTKASGLYSIAMGCNSVALSENAISIGKDCSANIVSGAIVGGGSIAMGDSSIVTITRSMAMGYKCISNAGLAFGYRTKVSGGGSASAWGAYTVGSGFNSIAFGYYASNNVKATSFVFADNSSTLVTANTVNYQFMARASGGVVFYSDPLLAGGVQLFSGGGAWASVSDSAKKENLKFEDPDLILQKIMELEVFTWNYKSQSRKIRHIGPTAQAFYSAFLLGESQRSICTIDIDGVNLLGIKALEKQTSECGFKLNSIDEIKTELKLIDNFSVLDERLKKIEEILNNK